ncbi:sensor histidine kinase [Falsiroseomonas sp. E2-1-a20]|uniref:sensor histidine kinase n=1 Tax=Falsiroseomonas sp. E2-1-a20 TaxID=3239300 RepID=UPI003F40EC90
MPTAAPTGRFHKPVQWLRALPTPLRWSGGAFLVLIAFALHGATFGPVPAMPFLSFLPPVILASVFLGRGSGLIAVTISTALSIYFFIEPKFQFALPTSADTIGAILFVLTGCFIASMAEALQRARVRADLAQRDDKAALARAKAAWHDLDLLLVEFGHRTKNDLQRITATLMMQAASAAPEVGEALRAAAERVRVVAHMHDRLARRDGHVLVDVRVFLEDLIADLRSSTAYLRPVGMFIEAEQHMLSVNRAGAVGLIVNELVTNALKHAFPDDREGAIRVTFRSSGPDYLLVVADDGVGMPQKPADDSRRPAKQGGMGRRLVRALAAQLGGGIETSRAEPSGTVSTIRIPVNAPGTHDAPV